MDLKQLLSQTTVGAEESVIETDEGVPKPSVEPAELGSDGEGVVQEHEGIEDVKEEDVKEEEEEVKEKIDSRFTLPWNKLEKGVKMNRLLIFIQTEREEHKLTEQQAKELKNLLFKACENGLFNKISDVEYDESNAEIKSIKNLEFNESSKKYKIKTGGTKNRSVSKSRSNIDRLTKKK